MALEIERRFLIKNDNWKHFINKKVCIEQGYFFQSIDGWIIRVRLIGKSSKITLKKHIKSFTNFEFEYSIPRSDAEIIMSNLSNTIKKDRYFLEIEKKSWVIDCFKENNYPLEIAEIELSNEEEDLFLPSFISKEITGLTHYSNFSLANNPFSQWKED
ncbi:MAG: CYTH domain-containing protein [Prochlorococcus marinus CUG1437]|nr:CYTH domain-containing protein [Prochlorococcus marinus CUG1437]